MVHKIKDRLAREESGFTLIELLVVIIILGILLAIAIPSYLSFKDRANKTAAAADVRAALPSVASYGADNTPGSANDPDSSASDQGYTGMTWSELQTSYDSALAQNVYVMGDAGHTLSVTGLATDFIPDPTAGAGQTNLTAPDSTHYCIFSDVGSWYAWKSGDKGTIQTGTDPSAVCQS